MASRSYESALPIAVAIHSWDAACCHSRSHAGDTAISFLCDHESAATYCSGGLLPIAGLLLSLDSFSRTNLPSRSRVDWILPCGLRLAVDRSGPLCHTGWPLDSSEANRRHCALLRCLSIGW